MLRRNNTDLFGIITKALGPSGGGFGIGGPIPDPDNMDPDEARRLEKERQDRIRILYHDVAKETKYGRVKGGEEEYKTGLATYRMLQEEKYAGTSEADVRKRSPCKRSSVGSPYA